MLDAQYRKEEVVATDAERARHRAFGDALRERARRPGTIDAYRKDWLSLARWYWDTSGQSFDLTALTPMDAADYLSFLVRTAKPATIARRLLFLRTYVADAVRRREVSDDFSRRIQLLRAPKPQPAAPRGLTTDEARMALRNVEHDGSPRDKAMLFLFFMTGLRVSELAGLDQRDVQLGERSGTALIRADVAKGGRQREVPIAKEARDYVRDYLSSRIDHEPALFVGQRGRMTPSGIRSLVAKHAGVSPHRIRHTFAYEYLRANSNDLVALADILGHASLNTTRGYTRRRREDLEAGVQRVRYGARDSG